MTTNSSHNLFWPKTVIITNVSSVRRWFIVQERRHSRIVLSKSIRRANRLRRNPLSVRKNTFLSLTDFLSRPNCKLDVRTRAGQVRAFSSTSMSTSIDSLSTSMSTSTSTNTIV